MRERLHHLREELKEHLPYTVFSVAVGIAILGILTFVAELLGMDMDRPAQGLFHVFHPMHMLFSAAATTAMFWRHERKLVKSIIIGFLGSAVICAASDILMPYISGYLMGVEMELHICIIKHPMTVLPFIAMGILLGLVVSAETHKGTIFSHTAHILVSSMASILYLISYGLSEWMHMAGPIFIYMVLAVIIPCCTSDIVFPILLTKKKEE